MRVISKLIGVSAGEIRFEGRALNDVDPHRIIELGIAHVPEHRRLFPRMAERRNQPAGTMSGGEQQMCAIARGLMSKPKLLLLDEPSAGLAPVIVQRVFEVVQKIRSEGYTVLIVEQNVQQVLKVVDRAYLLEVGRIKRSARAAELAKSDDIRRAYVGI
jgi:branched-chain amino acid transport system ATP-binding protein